MERLQLPDGIKADQQFFLNNLMDGILGNPQILDSSPTTAGEQLSENSLGFDGTNLFITLQGTTYKLALVAV